MYTNGCYKIQLRVVDIYNCGGLYDMYNWGYMIGKLHIELRIHSGTKNKQYTIEILYRYVQQRPGGVKIDCTTKSYHFTRGEEL